MAQSILWASRSGRRLRAVEAWYALTETRAYDIVMRVPAALWPLWLAISEAIALRSFVARADGIDMAFVAGCLARGALILFLSTIPLLVIARSRPVGKAAGIGPRLSALAGSFLMLSLVLFPRVELGPAMSLLSTFLLLVGNALALFVVMRLGPSYSIMPEARRLVTEGPYRIVRHPLYVAEEIPVLGVFLQFASPGTAVLLLLHFCLQLQRIRNEEAVLRATFPDYDAYAQKTACLIPGLY